MVAKWRKIDMKMDEIISAIQDLSYSQGFYGRLLRDILEIKEYDEESYNDLKETLEKQNFKDVLDMVMFFEC